jgi:hypothetical protein
VREKTENHYQQTNALMPIPATIKDQQMRRNERGSVGKNLRVAISFNVVERKNYSHNRKPPLSL